MTVNVYAQLTCEGAGCDSVYPLHPAAYGPRQTGAGVSTIAELRSRATHYGGWQTRPPGNAPGQDLCPDCQPPIPGSTLSWDGILAAYPKFDGDPMASARIEMSRATAEQIPRETFNGALGFGGIVASGIAVFYDNKLPPGTWRIIDQGGNEIQRYDPPTADSP